MRILQVIETGGPGGAETVFARLASALAGRQHHVHCMTSDGSWLPQELARRGLTRSAWTTTGAFDLALIGRLRECMRRERIEVVHAHLFEGAVYAVIAARSLGVPCVVTLHGQVDAGRTGLKERVKRRVLTTLAARVVMVSQALDRDLRRKLRIPPDSLRVIHNGVPVGSVPRRLSARLDDSGPPRLLAIGNIRVPKNYPGLLNALAQLREVIPGVTLDILGEPDADGLFEGLQNQVRALGLQSAVAFHGFVADPQPFLETAAALVLASSSEGFSLAIVEAMLAGVPVVSTRSGGPEEIVANGETGVLVPAGDDTALASALSRVLADRTSAEAMALRARAAAETKFGLERMVTAYESLYAEVVTPVGSPNVTMASLR